jgi:hypothetical protein
MKFVGALTATQSAKSIQEDFLALGLICIACGLVSVLTWFKTRRRTSTWDVNPLQNDVRSNLKRAYHASAQIRWTMYFSWGVVAVGIVLVIVAGAMSL